MKQKTLKTLASVALATAVIVLTTGSSAHAVNPANWNFFLETLGADVQWDSPTQVDTGHPLYEIDFEVTQLEAQLGGVQWLNLFAVGVDPNDYKASATVPGPLPVVILSDAITNDDNGSLSNIDIAMWIDGAGEGHLSFSNVSFGTFNGLPLTGLRMGGTFDVLGVPEPTSMALLGCAGLATMFTRRRRS